MKDINDVLKVFSKLETFFAGLSDEDKDEILWYEISRAKQFLSSANGVDTLTQAKTKLAGFMDHKKLHDKLYRSGTTCEVCGQFVKVYPRQVHSTMASSLVDFYRLVYLDDVRQGKVGEWHHVGDIFTKSSSPMHRLNGGDWAKMAEWGLIEERPKNPNDLTKRTSGYWRITDYGILFVLAQVKIPKYKYIYNDTVIGESKDITVSIQDCLGKEFNYQQLMSGNGAK